MTKEQQDRSVALAEQVMRMFESGAAGVVERQIAAATSREARDLWLQVGRLVNASNQAAASR